MNIILKELKFNRFSPNLRVNDHVSFNSKRILNRFQISFAENFGIPCSLYRLYNVGKIKSCLSRYWDKHYARK